MQFNHPEQGNPELAIFAVEIDGFRDPNVNSAVCEPACWHWWRGRWLWRCLYKPAVRIQCSKSEEVYSLCIRLSSCNCKSTSSPTRAQVCDASNAAAMTAFCLRPKACDEKLRLQNCQDTAQSAMPCLALVQGLTEGQTCRSRC